MKLAATSTDPPYKELNMSDIELPDLPTLKTEHWRAVLAEDQRPHQLHTRLHVVGFRTYEACEGFVASELDMNGWRYGIEELVLRSDAEAAIIADREKRCGQGWTSNLGLVVFGTEQTDREKRAQAAQPMTLADAAKSFPNGLFGAPAISKPVQANIERVAEQKFFAQDPREGPVQAEAPSADADPLTPEQEEWVMDLAEKHNLGRRMSGSTPRGLVPDVFYTDASYRTHELFCFAAELLAVRQAGQEPVASIYVSPNGEREFDDWGHHLPVGRNELCLATKQAEAPTASNERELEQALKERDDVEDMADQLAAQIAAITGADIGEHTSANDPWRNAMLAADEWIAEDLRRMFDGRPEQPRPPAGSLAAQAIWMADNAPPSTSKELIESWQVNTIETLHQCATALATQQEAPNALERENAQLRRDIAEMVRSDADAALAAFKAAPNGVPAGWKLVPVEPTGPMTYAGQQLRHNTANSMGTIYQAMLSETPALPATQQEAQPQADGSLSFNCTNGCGACGVKLRDFVTHATQAQDSDDWVTVASEPEIVSTCCGSPVEVWDERKQDIVGQVRAARAEPAGGDKEDAERWRLLPAFIEDHQIDYVKLLHDIDTERAARAAQQATDKKGGA